MAQETITEMRVSRAFAQSWPQRLRAPSSRRVRRLFSLPRPIFDSRISRFPFFVADPSFLSHNRALDLLANFSFLSLFARNTSRIPYSIIEFDLFIFHRRSSVRNIIVISSSSRILVNFIAFIMGREK